MRAYAHRRKQKRRRFHGKKRRNRNENHLRNAQKIKIQLRQRKRRNESNEETNEDGDQQNTDNMRKMCVLMLFFFFILALCMFRLFRSLPADTSGWFEFRLAGSTLLFYPFTLISFVKPFPIAWDCNRSYVKSTQILLWLIIFSFAHHRWASREKFQRFECIFFFYRPNWKFLLHHQSRTRFQVLWYSLIRHFFFMRIRIFPRNNNFNNFTKTRFKIWEQHK